MTLWPGIESIYGDGFNGDSFYPKWGEILPDIMQA